MNLSFFIAKRYLISKKSNNAINVISWISIVAIAVTTAALIIVLSAMNGLTSVVADLYHAIEPDLKITATDSKYMTEKKELTEKINSVEGINGISYSIEENALMKIDDKQAIVTIKGVDDDFKNLTHFDTVVVDGVYRFIYNNQYYGVFGRGIANRLDININDFISPISIYAPVRGKVESINPEDAFNKITISPAGIFSLNDDFDYKYVLVDLKAAQQLFDCQDAFSIIELSVKNKDQLNSIQKQLQEKLGSGYIIKNRYQVNDVLFKTLETEKLWTFLILAFILVIATFNIIGALTMLIIEKKKDIKTLYNLGADQKLIQNIFMQEGFLITSGGALTGLLIGTIVCILQQQFHLVTFDDQSVIAYYPIKMEIKDFFWVLGVVMGIGFLAAIYPVRIFTKNDLVHLNE
ncbi:MAG: FtsX-like permease family protein [Burkholderiales bacterium]|nr:FtsX-like permease family protein [Bacteroidia bacterium]